MKKLVNDKPTGKIIMLVAESQDDWECLDTLYHDGICFGAYMLYHFKDDRTKSIPLYNWLSKNFPLCYGIMQISVVKGFASKPDKIEL
jgi:hypothetical protein